MLLVQPGDTGGATAPGHHGGRSRRFLDAAGNGQPPYLEEGLIGHAHSPVAGQGARDVRGAAAAEEGSDQAAKQVAGIGHDAEACQCALIGVRISSHPQPQPLVLRQVGALGGQTLEVQAIDDDVVGAGRGAVALVKRALAAGPAAVRLAITIAIPQHLEPYRFLPLGAVHLDAQRRLEICLDGVRLDLHPQRLRLRLQESGGQQRHPAQEQVGQASMMFDQHLSIPPQGRRTLHCHRFSRNLGSPPGLAA